MVRVEEEEHLQSPTKGEGEIEAKRKDPPRIFLIGGDSARVDADVRITT
jgi:hypothetical protein